MNGACRRTADVKLNGGLRPPPCSLRSSRYRLLLYRPPGQPQEGKIPGVTEFGSRRRSSLPSAEAGPIYGPRGYCPIR